MKSKIFNLEMPESRYKIFINFCISLDITIITSYVKDDLFFENTVYSVIKVDGDNEIPLDLKIEKLKSEYGKYIL